MLFHKIFNLIFLLEKKFQVWERRKKAVELAVELIMLRAYMLKERAFCTKPFRNNHVKQRKL